MNIRLIFAITAILEAGLRLFEAFERRKRRQVWWLDLEDRQRLEQMAKDDQTGAVRRLLRRLERLEEERAAVRNAVNGQK